MYKCFGALDTINSNVSSQKIILIILLDSTSIGFFPDTDFPTLHRHRIFGVYFLRECYNNSILPVEIEILIHFEHDMIIVMEHF